MKMQQQVNSLKTEISQQEIKVKTADDETNKSAMSTFGSSFPAAALEIEEAETTRIDTIKQSIHKIGILQHLKVPENNK